MCQSTELLKSLRDNIKAMKIGLVGGGTGGHFYPLIAVATELQANTAKPQLFYFGPEPYDVTALQTANIKYIYCPAGKMRRYFSIQNFIDVFRNLVGLPLAIIKLFLIYPDVIFSKGGYTSIPVLLAARFLRIPIVIHESDAVPGRANMIAAKAARYIAISYDDAAKFFPEEKTALTGIPLRKEIIATTEDPFAVLGFSNDKPLIYVTGGSSGAERINNIIIRSLDTLLPHYRIFHQTGPANIEELRQAAQSLLGDSPDLNDYYLEGRLDAQTISALLQASALVITRAGSTTLFEIANHAKPSIVIPIPEDISRDQRTNAYAYARTGAATVIEEQNLTENLLAQEIGFIIQNPTKYQDMSNAAKAFYIEGSAKKISDILISIGQEHES
jgi:UDP-N-acetylglucosamine--N-acetylmuramyl-(pentapeptide) pyrophosphoryl-undecaprenol N-acetylglucosamine transferase